MKISSKFYAWMSFLCLISIEALRLTDIGIHIKYFMEHPLFLLNVIAYMTVGVLFIPFLLKGSRQGFIGGFIIGIFSIGFIALDPDLIPVLTSTLKPDTPLILLFALSPALSTLLCLFSYHGYKSLNSLN